MFKPVMSILKLQIVCKKIKLVCYKTAIFNWSPWMALSHLNEVTDWKQFFTHHLSSLCDLYNSDSAYIFFSYCAYSHSKNWQSLKHTVHSSCQLGVLTAPVDLK